MALCILLILDPLTKRHSPLKLDDHVAARYFLGLVSSIATRF